MKAQSAVEYLMTYGWSILIIAVVIASLVELGVFNSVNASPSSCIGVTGYSCSNPTLYASGALVTKLGQVSTGTITITGTACTKNSTVTSITPVTSTQLQSEQQSEIIFHCPLTSNATGTQFTGHLWIEYSTSAQQNIIQEVGVVQTPVVSANVVAYIQTAYITNVQGGTGYTGNILEINLNTGQAISGIPSDGTSGSFIYPKSIALSGTTAYVINGDGGSSHNGNILEINLNTGQVFNAIPSDDTSGSFYNPQGIALSGATAYVVNENGGTSPNNGNILEINLNTGQVFNAIPSDDTSGPFDAPVGIALSGTIAYVTNMNGGSGGTGNILEINLNTGQVFNAIPSALFHYPVGIALSGTTAYVINNNGGSGGTGNILEINLNTGQVIGAIPSDGTSGPFYYPENIALSGTTAYVVNSNAGNIIKINIDTDQVIGAISSVALENPDGISIYTPTTP